MQNKGRLLRLASLMLLVTSGAAQAESTGWITGRQLWAVTGDYDRRGMLPVAVECKDSGKKSFDLAAGLVKMEFVPNKEKLAWWWVGSTNFKFDVAEMKAKGYHLAAKSSFTRKQSGTPVYCLIFHK